MKMSERIKSIRLSKGLTQKEVAARCGVADSAIRKYESGKVTPKFEMLDKIASALGVPIVALYGYNFVGTDEKGRDIYECPNDIIDMELKTPTPVSEDGLDPELVALIKRIPADRMPEVERYLRFQAEQGENL